MARTKPVVFVKLTVLDPADQHPVRTVELRSPSYAMSIGRSSRSEATKTTGAANNGFFDSRVISREHAVIKAYPETKKIVIEDLGSMHGTFINDRRVNSGKQEILAAYDTLRFGAVVARGPDTFLALRATFDCDFINEPKTDLTSEIEEVFLVSDDEDSDVEIVQESVRHPDFTVPDVSRTFSVPDSDLSAAGSFVSDDDQVDEDELDYEPPDKFLPTSARTMMKEAEQPTSSNTVSRDPSSQMRGSVGQDPEVDQVQFVNEATEVVAETMSMSATESQVHATDHDGQVEVTASPTDKAMNLTQLLTDPELEEEYDDDSLFSEPTSPEESDDQEFDDSSSMNSEDRTPPLSPAVPHSHSQVAMRTPPWGFSVGIPEDELTQHMKTPPPVHVSWPRSTTPEPHIHDQARPARLPSPSDAAMPKSCSGVQERSSAHNFIRADSYPDASQPPVPYNGPWYSLPVENYEFMHYPPAMAAPEPADNHAEETEPRWQTRPFPTVYPPAYGASDMIHVREDVSSMGVQPINSSQMWTDQVEYVNPIPAPKPRSSTKVTIDEIVEQSVPQVPATSSSTEMESRTESITPITNAESSNLKRKADELEDDSEENFEITATTEAQAIPVPTDLDLKVNVARIEEQPRKKAKTIGPRPMSAWGTHVAAAGAGVLVGFFGLLGTLLALPQDSFPDA